MHPDFEPMRSGLCPIECRVYVNGATGDLHRFRVVTFPVDASTCASTPAERPQKLTSKEYQNTSK